MLSCFGTTHRITEKVTLGISTMQHMLKKGGKGFWWSQCLAHANKLDCKLEEFMSVHPLIWCYAISIVRKTCARSIVKRRIGDLHVSLGTISVHIRERTNLGVGFSHPVGKSNNRNISQSLRSTTVRSRIRTHRPLRKCKESNRLRCGFRE